VPSRPGRFPRPKDAHGQWHIEPAELHRVYPPRTEVSTEERIRAHISEIALLRERIEDLKTLTDEFRVWVRDLTEQRDRAEARAAELDKRLLAYQPPAPTLPPPRRRWWRRSASTCSESRYIPADSPRNDPATTQREPM
jgi:FtsZ-binding cell division protein ZapB